MKQDYRRGRFASGKQLRYIVTLAEQAGLSRVHYSADDWSVEFKAKVIGICDPTWVEDFVVGDAEIDVDKYMEDWDGFEAVMRMFTMTEASEIIEYLLELHNDIPDNQIEAIRVLQNSSDPDSSATQAKYEEVLVGVPQPPPDDYKQV